MQKTKHLTGEEWPTGGRDSGLQDHRHIAKRFERDGLPRKRRAVEPDSGGHHDSPRPVLVPPTSNFMRATQEVTPHRHGVTDPTFTPATQVVASLIPPSTSAINRLPSL